MDIQLNANPANFTVACCNKTHLFNIAEVVRLEASSNYTLIHTINKRPLVVAKVLAAYEEILEGWGFIRVHRSHLINKRYVQSMGAHTITLYEGLTVEVPRRKRKEVMRQLRSNGCAA